VLSLVVCARLLLEGRAPLGRLPAPEQLEEEPEEEEEEEEETLRSRPDSLLCGRSPFAVFAAVKLSPLPAASEQQGQSAAHWTLLGALCSAARLLEAPDEDEDEDDEEDKAAHWHEQSGAQEVPEVPLVLVVRRPTCSAEGCSQGHLAAVEAASCTCRQPEVAHLHSWLRCDLATWASWAPLGLQGGGAGCREEEAWQQLSLSVGALSWVLKSELLE